MVQSVVLDISEAYTIQQLCNKISSLSHVREFSFSDYQFSSNRRYDIPFGLCTLIKLHVPFYYTAKKSLFSPFATESLL